MCDFVQYVNIVKQHFVQYFSNRFIINILCNIL